MPRTLGSPQAQAAHARVGPGLPLQSEAHTLAPIAHSLLQRCLCLLTMPAAGSGHMLVLQVFAAHEQSDSHRHRLAIYARRAAFAPQLYSLRLSRVRLPYVGMRAQASNARALLYKPRSASNKNKPCSQAYGFDRIVRRFASPAHAGATLGTHRYASPCVWRLQHFPSCPNLTNVLMVCRSASFR